MFSFIHFFIQGYSAVCTMDRNYKGGGIMLLFVKDGIIFFPLYRYSFQLGF